MKQETSQHTPGPWEILSALNNHMICDSKKSVVAVAVNSNEEANARLIAAAPLLLEAVKGMYASLAWHIDNNGHYGMDQKRMDDARAAIAATQL